ncbi:MAG: hypothetical protein AAF500_10995 [Myxococcota bacterium]
MRQGIGRMVAAMLAVIVVALAAGPGASRAQAESDDAAGREFFERGRAAFGDADYERALVYFRHAYRLSARPELQYNIGVAADRLQREEEALEAFESYLANTKAPAREAEVKERIAALRASIEERDATERALVDATIENRADDPPMSHGDRTHLPASAIAGGSALAAVGLAGVAAMAVGLARDGSCAESSSAGCTTEQSATGWTAAYGALGFAALAGSATWFAISAKRAKERHREVTWRLSPSGVMVSGTF